MNLSTSRVKKWYRLFLSMAIVSMSIGGLGVLTSHKSSAEIRELNAGELWKVPDKWIKEQTLSISLDSTRTDYQVGIARRKGKHLDTSGCVNSSDIICMSVRRIRLEEENLYSVTTKIEYIDQNQNRTYLVSTTNLNVKDTHFVTLQISDGHWRKLLVNGRLIQAARYRFNIGVTGREIAIAVDAASTNNLGATSSNFSIETTDKGTKWIFSFFVGFFLTGLLLLVLIFRKSRLNTANIFSKSVFQQITVLSGLITGLTYILQRFGIFGTGRSYDRSGILYSELVRFSDFFEVWNLNEFHELYASRNPDYPPAMIGLLAHTKSWFRPEYALLLVIGSAFLTHVTLIYRRASSSHLLNAATALFFAVSSAPLLFAIDRGGLDLLVYPLIVFGVVRHSEGRFKEANVLIAAAAAIKILPIVFVVSQWRRDNHGRKILAVVLSAGAVNLLGAVLLPEKGITEFLLYFKKMLIRSGGEIPDAVVTYNNSAWSLMRAIQIGSFNLGFGPIEGLKIVWSISMILLLAFVAFWLWFRSETGPARCVVLVSTMLLVVPLSGNYRLLYLYPALWYLDKELVIKSHSLRNSLVIVGSLLLSVCPIYYFGNSDINLGQIVKPILLTLMILIVCYSDDKRRKENSVPIEIVAAL